MGRGVGRRLAWRWVPAWGWGLGWGCWLAWGWGLAWGWWLAWRWWWAWWRASLRKCVRCPCIDYPSRLDGLKFSVGVGDGGKCRNVLLMLALAIYDSAWREGFLIAFL